MSKEVTLNKNGVNSFIKASILSEQEMRKIGFTDYSKDTWYFCRMIKLPNDKRYRGFEVSFGVSINKKDLEDLRIDVLDEAFCQPYDYQVMLRDNPKFKTALIVNEQVEEWMKYLHDNGVLSGHVEGEYI